MERFSCFYAIVFSYYSVHAHQANIVYYIAYDENLSVSSKVSAAKLFKYQWQAQKVLESLPYEKQLSANIIKLPILD